MHENDTPAMDSLRKSLKSHGSYKQTQKNQDDVYDKEGMLKFDGLGCERGEVVVKIDGSRDIGVSESRDNLWGGSRFWQGGCDMSRHRKSSREFDFLQGSTLDDSSTKLIREFSGVQKEVGETSLHVDVGMKEQQPQHWFPPPKDISNQQKQQVMSKDLKVSFQDHSVRGTDLSPNTMRRRYKGSSDDDDEEDKSEKLTGLSLKAGEVTKCTSNASFKKNQDMLRSKTKSRLLDPTPQDNHKSGKMKSDLLKSGMLGVDEDDEDPFYDEDIPDGLKKEYLRTATMLEWMSLIIILILFIGSLLIPYLKEKEVLNLHLWKWEVLILVLICGGLVSGFVIKIAVFFIERNFLLHRHVLYFVYAVRKSVQNFLWLSMVLIAWHFLLDQKVQIETKSKHLPYITKILICLMVATLVNLIKTILVKSLASSFHVNTYFDRIQEALFNQYVIEVLSGPPLIEIQNNKDEEERVMAELQRLQNAGAKVPADLRAAVLPCKSARINTSGKVQSSSFAGKSFRISGAIPKGLNDEGIKIEQLSRLNQKNVSAWNMKRLMNIVRHGVLCTLDESIPDATLEDDSAMQIRNEFEAKAAAKKIFNNVAKPGCKYIYLIDLMRFMREDEAAKAMDLFEGAKERQRVNKTALKNWVALVEGSSAFLFKVEAFRERRALSLTLNDTKTAVNKLHQMFNVVVWIIIGIIWLLILEIATSHVLVLISSQIVLVTFVFGNTAKMVFEAIIFLFVMHPFDVGDRCEVDGVQMIVEEMNIMTTIFLRYDNLKITYPNNVLSTRPISNYYRSPDMGETIDLCVHVSTPLEKIAVFKESICKFIANNVEHWHPVPQVVLKDVDDMNRLKISIWPQHRINHQNMGERWSRRELVVEEMIRILRELEVEYRLLPVDVNLRQMPCLTSSRLPSNWLTCA